MTGRHTSAARLRELARLCRVDARRSQSDEARSLLAAKAEEYERQAAALEARER